jgi:hypothetical protein
MLARPTPNCPSRVAWANLTGAVFTVIEPEGSTAEKTRTMLADLLKALPELMKASDVKARREEDEEGEEAAEAYTEPRPPQLAKKDTHWIVPGKHRAVYALMLSTYLRKEQGGEAELEMPESTEGLKSGIPPEAYVYMRTLSEKLPNADPGGALQCTARPCPTHPKGCSMIPCHAIPCVPLMSMHVPLSHSCLATHGMRTNA